MYRFFLSAIVTIQFHNLRSWSLLSSSVKTVPFIWTHSTQHRLQILLIHLSNLKKLSFASKDCWYKICSSCSWGNYWWRERFHSMVDPVTCGTGHWGESTPPCQVWLLYHQMRTSVERPQLDLVFQSVSLQSVGSTSLIAHQMAINRRVDFFVIQMIALAHRSQSAMIFSSSVWRNLGPSICLSIVEIVAIY